VTVSDAEREKERERERERENTCRMRTDYPGRASSQQ